MRLTRGNIFTNLCVIGLLSFGLLACTQDQGGGGTTSQGGSGGGSGGTASGGSGSGGTISSGGTTTPSDSGGTVASGGTTSSGGAEETGGTTATGTGGRTPRGTGGSTSTDPSSGGDSEAGGSTGKAGTVGGTGGRTGPAMGGRMGTGGATVSGTGGSQQGTGGSTGTGACVKGQTKGNEVAVIGESFIDMSTITQELEKDAVAAGSLKSGEHYDDNAVSGTTLANDQIPSQYRKAVSDQGFIRYVFMDGGGNDCLINNNGNAALTAAQSLFKTMADDKTEKVVYFFYPDPIGNNFANLKTCLDSLRPKMKDLCDGLTAPKCYWLDLRDTWKGHSEYTQDGIHPTQAGSKATADAIWKVAVENCVAQ